MASHSGDGSPKEPLSKDSRWPLSEVCFTGPTKIPGISMMLTTLEAGVMKLVDGKEWHVGAMWYDPDARLISIEGAYFPLDRVHYMKRAKMAITKRPPPLDLDKFTHRAREARVKR